MNFSRHQKSIHRLTAPSRWLIVILWLTPAAWLHAQESQAILNALIRKGILTEAEAAQITKETASRASSRVIVEASNKSTTKLSIRGRLQIQQENHATDHADGNHPAAVNYFALRRAQLMVQGQLGPDKQINLTYDFASNNLTTASLTWQLNPAFKINVGQRKVNFSADEKNSSGSLKAVERSPATRYFVEENNGRRLGAGSHHLGLFADGTAGNFFWGAAVTNPERANTKVAVPASATNKPALWGGGGLSGKFEGGTYLFATNFGYLPDQGGRTTGSGNDLVVGGLNTALTLGAYSLIAEYLTSWNDHGSAAGTDANSWGAYLQPSYRFNQHWEAVARFSYVDSDGRGISLSDGVRSAPTAAPMDKLAEYYFGFTYYIHGNDLKIQSGYFYEQSKETVTGGPAKASTSGVRSQIQVQF